MTSLEAEQNRDEWIRVNSEEKHYKRINEQVQMFSILEQTQKYDNKPMNNSTPIANIIQINPLK